MYIFLSVLNLIFSFIISSVIFSKTSSYKPNDDSLFVFILSNESNIFTVLFIFIKLLLVTGTLYFIFKISLKEKKIKDFHYENLLSLTEKMISKKINLGFKYTNHVFLGIIFFIYSLILFKPDNYNISLFLMTGFLIGAYLFVTRKKIDYNQKALHRITKELNKVSKKENSYGQEYLNMPIGIMPKKNLEFFASDKFSFELSGLTKKKFNELKYYALIKLVFENNQKQIKEFKIFKY